MNRVQWEEKDNYWQEVAMSLRDKFKVVGEEKIRKFGSASRLITILFVLAFLTALFNPFIKIGAGERGVVLNFGAVQKTVLDEGLHFLIPIMQKVVKVDVKIHKSQTDADASSEDLQFTYSTIALNYHILPDKANVVYQTIGTQFKDRIIDPAVQEGVKAATARYTAVDLITKREKVKQEIREILKKRLITYNIVVDDFSIINFSFSKEFTQAIEQKQKAEQLALKAKRDLERIKIEAEQKVAQAKAEAESLRLQKAVISPELIELRKIEALQAAIEKWNGVPPQVMGGAVPFFDIGSLSKNSKR